jgi:hypothetical protein
MRRVILGLFIGLAVFACSDDTVSGSECGDGQAVQFEGYGYCVYRGAITEEGFDCPPGSPMMTEIPDFFICGPTGETLDAEDVEEIVARAEMGWINHSSSSDSGPGADMSPDVNTSVDFGLLPGDAGPGDMGGDGPADAGSVDVGADAPADAGPANRLVFDQPAFFDLPINSIRYALSGYDAAADICVTAVWFFTDQAAQDRLCSPDFDGQTVYFIVSPGESAGCWDYDGNATIDRVDGCVDWSAFGGTHTDAAEIEFQVTSPAWSGAVRFDNVP